MSRTPTAAPPSLPPPSRPQTRSVSRRILQASAAPPPPSSKRSRKIVASTLVSRPEPPDDDDDAAPFPFSTLPTTLVCHTLTWCDLVDMMCVARVSRLLKATSRMPASWRAVSVLDKCYAHRYALRTLVRDFPVALRSADSIGASVSNMRGFTSMSEFCYYACVHVAPESLPPGTLVLGPLHFANVQLRRINKGGGGGGGWASVATGDDWRYDARNREWKSPSATCSGGDDGDTVLPSDTLFFLQMRGNACGVPNGDDLAGAFERDVVALRPNATTRRLRLHNFGYIADLDSHLVTHAFPRLTSLSMRGGSSVIAAEVGAFLRTVFAGLRRLERLELRVPPNPYSVVEDIGRMSATDAEAARRRRTVLVPRALQSLRLDSRRTHRPLFDEHERAGRVSPAFLVLARDASLERLHIDAPLAALAPLARHGDWQQLEASSSALSTSSSTTSELDLVPHLTDLTLISGCLLDRTDLGRLLRLPTLVSVRLASMVLSEPGDLRRPENDGAATETSPSRAPVRLVLSGCEVSSDFVRDVTALYPSLGAFRVDGDMSPLYTTMNGVETMEILRDSAAFRAGTLRHIHFANASWAQFASPERAPRTGVSCRCWNGGCRDCACSRAGVKCGNECHVSQGRDQRIGITNCENADWPAYNTGYEPQRTDVTKHAVWLLKTPTPGGSAHRVDTAVILPLDDDVDADADCAGNAVLRATVGNGGDSVPRRPRHLTFARGARRETCEPHSWRVDALVYSTAIAALLGRGSRCVVSVGQYRDIFARDRRRHQSASDDDEKRSCVDPRCFCRATPRIWKASLGAAPTSSSIVASPSSSSSSSFSSSSTTLPSVSSSESPVDAEVRTKRGKRGFVHTVDGSGLLEATLMPVVSTT